MDIYLPMSTTARHNKFITALLLKVGKLVETAEAEVFHENCALVYWGEKKNSKSFELVDVNKLEDKEDFIDDVLLDLEYVQPDFVLFKENPFLQNKKQTRTAGCPDLVVEVWSKHNTKNDRAFLQNLYATSDITEHWYIEQDSNEVICYYGKNKIKNQFLTDILVTCNGLEFDLRYLAI
jgi:Uma2 family endonuclease